MKKIMIFPIKTKVLLFDDKCYGVVTGITIKPGSIIYSIEYFYDGILNCINLYDFQLEALNKDIKKLQEIGFADINNK